MSNFEKINKIKLEIEEHKNKIIELEKQLEEYGNLTLQEFNPHKLNNYEKIFLVEKICKPYFNFEIDDFFGDRCGEQLPKIEDLKFLYFKKKLALSKSEEQIMIDKISDLNIGSVNRIQIQSLGVYIGVEV
jgi:hypothetical protein